MPMTLMTILQWPKEALQSFNESWFWCGHTQREGRFLPVDVRPRLQIIRKATVWQRWLLWLEEHLQPVFAFLLIAVLVLAMVMTSEYAAVAAPSAGWTAPIEPPGVVLLTDSSDAKLPTQFMPSEQQARQSHPDMRTAQASNPTLTVGEAATSDLPVAALGSSTEAELTAALNAWSHAWRQKDVATYLAMYDEDFTAPKKQSREAWARMRSQRILSKRHIRHEMHQVHVVLNGSQALVSFEQRYADERLQQTDHKTMRWVWRAGHWRIAQETTS